MDLVRLALERSTSSREAVREIERLLAAYGQGGIADAHAAEPYWSSFLIVDPREAWIVETSGSTWAAKRIGPD
ncbi:secernin 3, isoform, partial [mine drainage metagenome]